jgi:predicted dehydrogenase
MSTYRTAIIGCGRISHTHAATYRRHPDIDLIAGVDVNAENLETFRSHWEVPHGFADYETMLSEIRPDLVSICTYVGTHWPMLKACAAAGVQGVICEKPMLNSPAELALARAMAADAGMKVVVGHMRRYGMGHQRARELFLAGEVGEPMLLAGALAGGDLAEMGSHWIDLMRYFSGDRDVEWVMGQTSMHDRRKCGHAFEDHAILYMQFQDGVKCVFEGGAETLKGDVFSLLTGSRGSIQVVGEDDLVIASEGGVRSENLADVQPDAWKSYGLELPEPWWNYKWDMLLRDFLQWIEGGEPPAVCLDNALKTTEVYLAAYLSAIRRDRVGLPLRDDDLTLDEWPGDVLARMAGQPSEAKGREA